MYRPVVALLALLVVNARAQAPLDDKFFDSHDVRIRYVESGNGEPVLLVHGFSVDLDTMWRDTGVIAALARDFRVIAMDARGHGKSGKPHDPASYGAAMVEDVTRLLDRLGVAKAHIVGYSMGGAIVGKFAVLHPERVRSLTFGGSSPRLWNDVLEKRSAEVAASLEQGKGLRPLIVALAPPGKPPSEQEIEERNRRQLARNDARALAAVQRSNRQHAVTPDEIRGMKMPLLAVVGSEDPARAAVENFKKLNPSVKTVVIDGAPHVGAEARPEFVAALREFLTTPPRP
jgi:pimeloyl-ACP methyl ester carboxylesterase